MDLKGQLNFAWYAKCFVSARSLVDTRSFLFRLSKKNQKIYALDGFLFSQFSFLKNHFDVYSYTI